jgi:hypothetical protein
MDDLDKQILALLVEESRQIPDLLGRDVEWRHVSMGSSQHDRHFLARHYFRRRWDALHDQYHLLLRGDRHSPTPWEPPAPLDAVQTWLAAPARRSCVRAFRRW